MGNKAIVESICKKCGSRDPFEIARQHGILVIYEQLGTIRGYYNKIFRQRWIHINAELNEHDQVFVCAHELGHAILHPASNTPFLHEHTFFSVNRLEMEANRFAVDLLFVDCDLQCFLDRPIADAAQMMGVPISLAEYRMGSVEPVLYW